MSITTEHHSFDRGYEIRTEMVPDETKTGYMVYKNGRWITDADFSLASATKAIDKLIANQ